MHKGRIDHEFRPPLPAVYDDAMTLYEGCAKHRKVTNDLINTLNGINSRVEELENQTQEYPDIKQDVEQSKDDINNLNGQVSGNTSNINDIKKDVTDNSKDIGDLEDRVNVLEGEAFEGVTPPSKEEYDANNERIDGEISNLYEIVASGSPVKIETFDCGTAHLLEVDEVGGDNWTIISSDLKVAGYYHQIGALVVGEFLVSMSTIGGEIIAPKNDKYVLTWKGTSNLPVPKNDIPDIPIASGTVSNKSVNMGYMAKTNNHVRGNMFYHFLDQHSDVVGSGYKYVFNGVITDVQRANEEMFRIPFTFITDFKKSEWDYELYDENFNYDHILSTELLLRSTENIDKPFFMEMEIDNLAGKNSGSGIGSYPYIYGDGLIFNHLESYTSGNYEAHLYDTRESTQDKYKRLFMTSDSGTWKIVITRDSSHGTSCTSYLNGALYATLSSTTYGINDTRAFTLGGNYDDVQNTYAKFKLNYFKFKWL